MASKQPREAPEQLFMKGVVYELNLLSSPLSILFHLETSSCSIHIEIHVGILSFFPSGTQLFSNHALGYF
jgi:hypothetical protein